MGRGARFLVGLGLSLILVSRSQIGGDQLNLLARGWLLTAHGTWIPYGNPTSAGGNEPGGFTSLLMALPLWVWSNHHAPTLLVLLSHIGAYALLDDVLRRTTGKPERMLFAVLYWLNPWRLYFSGHLWNPNFLFLAAAVHAWTSYRQRLRPRLVWSFVHVATIGFACQLHPSAIALAIASALLAWKRALRMHTVGAAMGTLLVVVSLVPWIREAAHDPAIVPVGRGFIGRGLIFVFPLVRGLLYWIRYASLAVGGRMVPLDFTALVGTAIDRWLAPTASIVVNVAGIASMIPAIMANTWLLRRAWRGRFTALPAERTSGRRWLETYVVAVFASTVVTFCLAPTTVMYWQGFVVLHAAVLPLVLWAGVLLRTRHAASVRVGLRVAEVSAVLLIVLLAAGSSNYRCGGRDGLELTLKQDYPMIRELRIDETCHVSIDPESGWTPDVFRRDE